MNDCILLFYVDVITYSCPNLDADLANICWQNVSWYSFNSLRASDAGVKPLSEPVLEYC